MSRTDMLLILEYVHRRQQGLCPEDALSEAASTVLLPPQIRRIAQNVANLREAGASEVVINVYLKSEGFSRDAWLTAAAAADGSLDRPIEPKTGN